MQYLMCEVSVGYELSWLTRSLSFYDSYDSQKMLVSKVRVAALKMCSVMDEQISKAIEGVSELYMSFSLLCQSCLRWQPFPTAGPTDFPSTGPNMPRSWALIQRDPFSPPSVLILVSDANSHASHCEH